MIPLVYTHTHTQPYIKSNRILEHTSRYWRWLSVGKGDEQWPKKRWLSCVEEMFCPKLRLKRTVCSASLRVSWRPFLWGLREGRAMGLWELTPLGEGAPCQRWNPVAWEHPINSPRSICHPLLLSYMTWYLWLMNHVWWWFQIIHATNRTHHWEEYDFFGPCEVKQQVMPS